MTLSTIGFEDAWQAYRDCETRLPPKPTPVEPIVVDGVVDAVARLGARAVVLDGFGVLNNGTDALPGAAEAVARLRRLGIPIRVLTNDASALPAEIAARHRRRGVEIDDDEVVSGLGLLASRLDERPGGWLVVATQVMVPELVELGLSLWDGSPSQLDAAGGFVMLESDDWDDARQDRLECSLRCNPRALIVTNPDIAAPWSDLPPGRLAADPGWYSHRLADAVGIEPLFLGKPFPPVYRRVLETLPGIAPADVLAVGDSPHTDILGGRNAGLRTLLLGTGLLSGRDLGAYARACGILPDLIAPAIGEP